MLHLSINTNVIATAVFICPMMLAQLKQSEYTGQNRCWPCTLLNAGISLVIGIFSWVILLITNPLPSLHAGAVGLGLIIGCLLVIYFRGYLIPGTPTFTQRYLPTAVLEKFGKTTEIGTEGLDADINPETILLQNSIISSCAAEDDLCIDPEFRRQWNTTIEDIHNQGAESKQLIEDFGISVDEWRVEKQNDVRVLWADSTLIGKWPSEAALLADAAAASILSLEYPFWGELSHAEKRELLYALRLFIEDCPTDDSGVEFGKKQVNSSCCGSTEVLAVTCSGTNEQLFEGVI